MPRRKTTKSSSSPDHSKSEQNDGNTNPPDPGIPLRKFKDAKGRKKVSINFPVEVKTKSGKITAADVVDVTDVLATLEKTPQMMKTKGQLRQAMTKYYGDDKIIRNKIDKLVCQKKKDEKHQKKLSGKHQRKSADDNHQWIPEKEHELVKETHETKSAEDHNDQKPVEEKNEIKPVEENIGRKPAEENNRKPTIESRAVKKQAQKEAREAAKREAMRIAREAKEAKKREMEEKKKEIEEKKRELEEKKRELEQRRREAEIEAKKAIDKEVEERVKAMTKIVDAHRISEAVVLKNNKYYKPTHCLKYMTLEMHPDLAAQWYMSDAQREVRELGAGVLATDTICDEGLVFWTRYAPRALNVETQEMTLGVMKQQCPRALYVETAAALNARALAAEAKLLNATEEERQVAGLNACAQHINYIRVLSYTTLTYVVFGPSKFSSNLAAGKGKSRERFCKLIFDLQLELMLFKVDLITVETPMDLARIFVNFTRAIADVPFKRTQYIIDENADFYMRGDNKHCVVVDKDGNGLGRLWEQMIAVLPQSSLEIARSFGARYNNPNALVQEFQTANGRARVADLKISRTNVPEAKARRLGPEFTRKLYTLFTAENGDTVIE